MQSATVSIRVADLPQFERLMAALRKVYAHPGTHPNHLGGCVGVLSEPSCECGMADLRFAVMALYGADLMSDEPTPDSA